MTPKISIYIITGGFKSSYVIYSITCSDQIATTKIWLKTAQNILPHGCYCDEDTSVQHL